MTCLTCGRESCGPFCSQPCLEEGVRQEVPEVNLQKCPECLTKLEVVDLVPLEDKIHQALRSIGIAVDLNAAFQMECRCEGCGWTGLQILVRGRRCGKG